jgi:endonuclease-3
MNKKDIQFILDNLDELYGTEIICYLNYEKPYELLIATILSAQCTDARVNIITKDLFTKYTNLESFATADLSELEEDIKPAGLFKNKAKNIIACCKTLLDEYDGQVPSDIDKLTKLPGVGRKTGNVIRGNIYGIESVVVDTHVKRLSNLIGLTDEDDPVKIEMDLMKKIPKDHWIIINKQLMAHGRAVCIARRPKCDECTLSKVCKYAKNISDKK